MYLGVGGDSVYWAMWGVGKLSLVLNEGVSSPR